MTLGHPCGILPEMAVLFQLVSLLLTICVALTSAVRPATADSIDESLYRTIHEDWQSPFLDDLMSGASHVGDGEVGILFCSVLMGFGDERAHETGKLAFVSLLGAGAVASSMKYIINRKRPDSDSDNRFNSSFPSGHVSGAFAVTSIVGSKYNALRIPAYVLASTIALSRVYRGRHYPSDVLAGAGVGIFVGWLVIKNESAILSFNF